MVSKLNQSGLSTHSFPVSGTTNPLYGAFLLSDRFGEIFMKGFDSDEAGWLFNILCSLDRADAAAPLGRAAINDMMTDRRSYPMAARLLKTMDSDPRFEKAGPPHSEYRRWFEETYGRRRSFWLEYNDS